MLIIESDGLPFWSLDASETEDSTKCLLVEVVGKIASEWRGGKNRETVTASLCLILETLVAPAMATPDWLK